MGRRGKQRAPAAGSTPKLPAAAATGDDRGLERTEVLDGLGRGAAAAAEATHLEAPSAHGAVGAAIAATPPLPPVRGPARDGESTPSAGAAAVAASVSSLVSASPSPQSPATLEDKMRLAATERGYGSLTDLPDRALHNILEFLDAPTLARARGLCRAWRTTASDEVLWRHHCRLACSVNVDLDLFARTKRAARAARSWRAVYPTIPIVRAAGVYTLRQAYFREPYRDAWHRPPPFLQCVYHRTFVFRMDGSLLYGNVPGEAEESVKRIKRLRFGSRGEDAVFAGRYCLDGAVVRAEVTVEKGRQLWFTLEPVMEADPLDVLYHEQEGGPPPPLTSWLAVRRVLMTFPDAGPSPVGASTRGTSGDGTIPTPTLASATSGAGVDSDDEAGGRPGRRTRGFVWPAVDPVGSVSISSLEDLRFRFVPVDGL